MRLGPLALGAAISAVLTGAPLAAQAHAGDIDMDGRVLVELYVTMRDPSSKWGQGIPGAHLAVATDNVTLPLRTDWSGIAHVWLRPGGYRIESSQPLQYHGQSYTWTMPITVAPGLPTVTLTQANAAAVADLEPARDANATTARTRSGVSQHKDPAAATVLSFLFAGLGEFYADAPGRGALFMVADLAGTGLMITGISCNNHDDCAGNMTCQYVPSSAYNTPGYTECGYGPGKNGNRMLYSGAALSLAATVFSMIDAHRAATTFNREHGAFATLSTARPIVGMGLRGETRIGLALAVAP